jgi:hypothetical protein
MKYIILFLTISFCSCNWAKEKTKDTVNKTGEVVAKAGSEFVDGVAKGVEKTFQNKVVLSNQLQKQGLKTGKIIINNSDSATDNILTTYLIFDENFEMKITVKLIAENGQEYGRISQKIKGIKDEAKYFDFVFDKRTNINGKGTVIFE